MKIALIIYKIQNIFIIINNSRNPNIKKNNFIQM